MIQPLLQCVPISPICSAVGGAQGVAASRIVKPRTVMKFRPGLVRVEDRLADVDLHLLLVGFDPFELRPDGGVRFIHLGKPQPGIGPVGLELAIAAL